jgi:hypothetical protein
MTGGSSIAAMIFKAPPQLGQCSMSMSKTRLSSRASSCAPARPALERPRLRSRGRALVERVSPHVDVHVSSLGRLYEEEKLVSGFRIALLPEPFR